MESELVDPLMPAPECREPQRIVCGAKLRGKDETCKRFALRGRTRCALHGGKSPMGAESPHFKHGLFSKALPKNMRDKFAALMADPQLLEGRAEVSLLNIRLAELAGRCGSNESGESWKTLKRLMASFRAANTAGDTAGMLGALNAMDALINGKVDDTKAWDELTQAMELASKISEREWKRVLANENVATAEQVRALVAAITNVVLSHVTDTPTRQAIAVGIQQLRVIDVPAASGDAADDSG